jgi:hypothetical protein
VRRYCGRVTFIAQTLLMEYELDCIQHARCIMFRRASRMRYGGRGSASLVAGVILTCSCETKGFGVCMRLRYAVQTRPGARGTVWVMHCTSSFIATSVLC